MIEIQSVLNPFSNSDRDSMLGSLIKKFRFKFSLNDSARWGRGSRSSQPHRQEGRKPEDGPPELEQLWRDFNRRLNSLFGGGNSGGGRTPDMRGAGIGVAVIGAIVVFLWLVSGLFIVQEGQTGVVMTFGKFDHTTSSGMNWRWPYPIQSHEIVNVSQVRTVEIGYRTNVRNKQPIESLMLTGDQNIVDIQFAVQYRLNNAAEWLFSNRDPEDTVKQVAESAIREIVGKSKMDFVLYEGREQVASDALRLMQQIQDRYRTGVQITQVTMQGVQPPEQVQAAFDDAVKAGQDRERQKNEGQAYANGVIPRARGAASRLMQESEAYRARVVANAEGDASRFKQILVEYKKAPAVTRDRMYLDTMQQIFANTTKVMMDAKNGNNLIYLPLDKLIEQTRTADGGAEKSNSPVAPGTASTSSEVMQTIESAHPRSDSRSREERDSRDREGR